MSRHISYIGGLAKSGVDRFGAGMGLLLLSPIFLITALIVKRDGGPAFFGHTRIGQNGKPFKCWKFRSMDVNAGRILADLLARDPVARAEWDRDFKLKDDPRITKIGHFLRKTSLDELPQLYNVLKGDMSLVGPRPIVTGEIHYYGDHIADYYAMKPGITGLWQVSGRNDVTYDERVDLDRRYVSHWSFWQDIAILFRTVGVIFNRKGAY